MREQWARNIALLTGVLVVVLAMMFAIIQNPSEPAPGTAGETSGRTYPSAVLSEPDVEKQVLMAAGRRVFEAQRCARCHSIAGEGNPRNPLDGVGERRTVEAIRQWILAPAELKDQLPARSFQAKQAYRNQPPEDLDALVAYLQSLRPAVAMQEPAPALSAPTRQGPLQRMR
ncbi:MAG: cytochrome c [Proteobacteria bacterium]|nr:cytochrome c [Pseudomonadota bacterium]